MTLVWLFRVGPRGDGRGTVGTARAVPIIFFDPRKISSSGKKTGEKNVPRKKKIPVKYKKEDRR